VKDWPPNFGAPGRFVAGVLGADEEVLANGLIDGDHVLGDVGGQGAVGQVEVVIRAGDGTVPVASGPKGIALDDNSIRRVADKHGHLQCNNAALDEVESVVTSEPIVVKAASTEDLSVEAPEILSGGEAFAARIVSPTARRSVTITVRDEHGRIVAEVQKALRHSTIEYRAEPLDPGGYNLEVRDTAAACR
jgi:hypothetical protein